MVRKGFTGSDSNWSTSDREFPPGFKNRAWLPSRRPYMYPNTRCTIDSRVITPPPEIKMRSCGCKGSCEDLQHTRCTSLTYNLSQIPGSPPGPSKPSSAGFGQRQRRTTHVWSGTSLADADTISGGAMKVRRIRSFFASRPTSTRMACALMLPSRLPLL